MSSTLVPAHRRLRRARASTGTACTDLQGARVQLIRTALEAVEIDGAPGVAAAVTAIFHSPPGARFSHGEIRWRLVEPAGALFADVAPETAPDPTPVAFKVDRGGKIELALVSGPTLGAEASLAKEFTVYHCAVKSSGAASPRALWSLSENPETRQGIGHATRLAFTLRNGIERYLRYKLPQVTQVQAE